MICSHYRQVVYRVASCDFYSSISSAGQGFTASLGNAKVGFPEDKTPIHTVEG